MHLGGDARSAIAAYRSLLRHQPSHAAAWNNLGTLLARAGDHTGADSAFRQACTAQPDYGEAWNNLGILCAETRRHPEAVDCFERATTLEPGKAPWFSNLGNARIEVMQFRDALTAYDRAIALDPAVADYWANRAIAARSLGQADDAIASAERALAIDPAHRGALNNLGAILKEARRFDEAEATYRRALTLAPHDPTLLTNLASVFERRGDYTTMQALATEARDLDPANPEPWNLLANAAMESGDYAGAEHLYQEALRCEPDNRNANWNLALIWLLQGDYARGWPQFEWRKRLLSVVTDQGDYGPNAWDGSSLAGRTILVHAEQGVGDAIQFIRYAPLLKAHGAARVVVEAPYPIVPLLLGAAGVDAAVARGLELPPYDLHASLMSLPWLLGTTLDNVPATVPYIAAEPRPVASLVTAAPGVRRVGIVWAGNPIHARDFLRSVPFEVMQGLAGRPDLALFSLQKGEAPEAVLRTAGDPRIVDLAPHLRDFRDTAAAIAALDLVITVDTSVAHLAGALGVPTWVLLPSVPDFRWMLGRSDSPWYPTMRLFRQPAAGDWETVMREVRAALDHLAPAAPRAPLADVVVVPSLTRTPDDRPAFDLWVPLADLARPAVFRDYAAEVSGEGASWAARHFLREVVSSQGILVDATPGLGLVSVDVAQARHPARLRLVATDPDASRVRTLLAHRVPDLPVEEVPSLAAALASVPGLRLVLRTTSGGEAALAAALGGTHGGTPDIILVEGMRPQGSPLVPVLASRAGQLLALTLQDGEVQLDPLPPGDGVHDVVWLSDATLRALQPGPQAATPQPLGIDWQVGTGSGWGVYGLNLALEMAADGRYAPRLASVGAIEASPLVTDRLREILRAAGPTAPSCDLMLRALGNDLAGGDSWGRISARRNVGVVFFEDTRFTETARARAATLDLIVAGSTWNAQVLADQGFERVVTVLQGIDPSVFHPAPRRRLFGDRFVVFSGGKLEYRKGQDIVVAAFREFARRHPEALLVTAWHNPWASLLCDLDLAGHVHGLPEVSNGRLQLIPWLVANGIPASQVIDIGPQPNALMGQVVREADVALFPNRCEGGTNLVAMECMAAGVPTIVSANTGHLDLVATGGCHPLESQGRAPSPTRYFHASDGWGESSVDEVLAVLAQLHDDHHRREHLGAAGAAAMAPFTWARQVRRLLDVVDTVR